MRKAKVAVVTGYIPLMNHPRTPAEYGALGEKLKELKYPVLPNYQVVTACWLYALIDSLKFEPMWATGDNPKKNSLAYHCVQHEKFDWLYRALKNWPDYDTYVWIDYGICSQPGVTPALINDFLGRIRRNDMAIPGCWPVGEVVDSAPCWRFLGSTMVVPKWAVQDLKNLIKAVTLLHLNVTRRVTWEVNTLARAEQTGKVPIRWYVADHNASQFENYK